MAESTHFNISHYSDECLESCLHEFVQHNNVDAVMLAVQKGASVNIGNCSGETPLHVAAMNNNRLQCLKVLLKSESVDVNTKTRFGETPVSYSCQTSSDKILQILLEHGGDVHLSNSEKETPLHHACCTDCLNTVKLLVEAGANVNAKDIRGWTPLHNAMRTKNSVEVCNYLLQHGADANIPYEDGLLPLHVAVSDGNCELYDLLRSNTENDTILKYCTFPGPYGVDMVNRSVLCLASRFNDKALVERVLKSGLPRDVLNCPIVVENPFFCFDYVKEIRELQSLHENLVLFTPLCLFLKDHFMNYNSALDVLKMLIYNNICVADTFSSSDNLYVARPIEVLLHVRYEYFYRFKVISTLLENGIDADEECSDMPTKLLKLCIIKNAGKSVFMLLLKSSNVVEPEDILRWIIDNWDREFLLWYGIQDLIYMLLVLSPYVTMPLCVYNYFVTLPFYFAEEKNVSEKIKQICELSIRPLASYCRSVVRRQLHYETRNNLKQFTENLNSLPLPDSLISFLKFSEISFTINESKKSVNCQIMCNS